MSRSCRSLTLIPALAFALLAMMTKTKAERSSDAEAHHSPSTPIATGRAPGMKARLLSNNAGVRRYAIVLTKGDEVMSGLTDFAKQNKVTSANFTAIGALSRATVSWFDGSRKEYKLIPIEQQVELISMTGDIALYNEQPVVHTHVALASADGTLKDGNLIEADVFPTLELFLTVYPTPSHKQLDDATQLELIDPLVQ